MADLLVPAARSRTLARRTLAETLLVLGGSALVALSAQLRIDLGFTPVPITGQSFGVLIVGAALGSRRGALALGAYLAEGAAGLPVFAGGGCCVAWLLGPTAGYLWSYPAAAWVTGRLAERGWDRRPLTAVAAMLAGNVVIYLGGIAWLAAFVEGGALLVAGVLPFIPGDLLKIALAAAALPGAWALVRRVRPGGDGPTG